MFEIEKGKAPLSETERRLLVEELEKDERRVMQVCGLSRSPLHRGAAGLGLYAPSRFAIRAGLAALAAR